MEALEKLSSPPYCARQVSDIAVDGLPEFSSAATCWFQGRSQPSFCDLVIGEGRRWILALLPGLIGDQIVFVPLSDRDCWRPSIRFEVTEKMKLSAPWVDTSVFSVLWLRICVGVLRDRLEGRRILLGCFELLELGEGFFLLKSDRREDQEMVVSGGLGIVVEGLWIVVDRVLAVSRWVPSFSLASAGNLDGGSMVFGELLELPEQGMQGGDFLGSGLPEAVIGFEGEGQVINLPNCLLYVSVTCCFSYGYCC